MPHFKCSECQHEWDGRAGDDTCDWCGAVGEVIEEQTPLEQFMEELERNPHGGFGVEIADTLLPPDIRPERE